MDRLIANLVLGDHGAHAKNFALLHGEDGRTRLAPAYDLVCTSLYPALSEQFAMSIGPARTLPELNLAVWRDFARELGVGRTFLTDRVAERARAAPRALSDLFEHAGAENSSLSRDVYPSRRRRDFFERFARVVRASCRRLLRSVEAGA